MTGRSTLQHRQFSPRLALATATFVLFLSAPTWAQVADNLSACNARGSPEEVTRACAAVLTDGAATDLQRSTAHRRIGVAQQTQRNYQAAIQSFSSALAITPTDVDALAHRANSYLRSGQAANAVADMNAYVALRPNQASAYTGRAIAHLAAGNALRAIADVDRAAEIEPTNANHHNLRCWYRATNNLDLNVARTACDEALRLQPDEPNYLDSRGLVGLQQHRWQDAWNDYSRAGQLLSQMDEPPVHLAASVLYGRGIAARRLGTTFDGLREVMTAGEIEPGITESYRSYGQYYE